MEEAKVYVTLLLVQSIASDGHDGFKKLVLTALELIRQPWLTADLKLDDVLKVDASKRDELTAAYQLALQIGRTIAEGTSGNPRQIKRFLNALAVRQAIARARGLEEIVKRDVLAKLMLAERFRPDFYNAISLIAIASATGAVAALAELEAASTASKNGVGDGTGKDESQQLAEWLADTWLTTWATIQPPLGTLDLRPYAFVARDKRVQLGRAVANEAVSAVLTALAGGPMGLAGADGNFKALTPGDVEAVFEEWHNALLAAPSLKAKPDAFDGLCKLVEHHPQVHLKFVALLENLDVSQIGIWAGDRSPGPPVRRGIRPVKSYACGLPERLISRSKLLPLRWSKSWTATDGDLRFLWRSGKQHTPCTKLVGWSRFCGRRRNGACCSSRTCGRGVAQRCFVESFEPCEPATTWRTCWTKCPSCSNVASTLAS